MRTSSNNVIIHNGLKIKIVSFYTITKGFMNAAHFDLSYSQDQPQTNECLRFRDPTKWDASYRQLFGFPSVIFGSAAGNLLPSENLIMTVFSLCTFGFVEI